MTVMILMGRSTVGRSVLIRGIMRSGVLGMMWMRVRDIMFVSSWMWLARMFFRDCVGN